MDLLRRFHIFAALNTIRCVGVRHHHRFVHLTDALRDRHGSTLVMVTHAPELAVRCDRIIRLADGKIAGEGLA